MPKTPDADDTPEQATYRLTVREWPASEQPREKLAAHGEQALDTVQLLAILLRTGTAREDVVRLAQRLLVTYHGLAGLARAPLADLQNEYSMGLAKAVTIKASLELGRRLLREPGEHRPQITSPQDIVNLLMADMMTLDHECVRVVLLTTKNHVMAMPIIYQGSLNSSVVRMGELFKDAVRQTAAALIVVHNHPSGDPSPSPEDIALTREMVRAGRLLEIPVLDHIIIGQQRYVSLKERGLGFEA